MIAGHSAVGDDLALVLALAADPRRGEHPPQRLRRPLPPGRGRDPALVQVRAIERSDSPAQGTARRTPARSRPRPGAASACRPRSRTVGCRHPRPCRSRPAPRACAGSGGSCRRSPSAPPHRGYGPATAHPGRPRSILPVTVARSSRPARSHTSMNSSNSLGCRCSRSRCQTSTPSIVPAAQVVQHPLVLRPRLATPGAHVVVDVPIRHHLAVTAPPAARNPRAAGSPPADPPPDQTRSAHRSPREPQPDDATATQGTYTNTRMGERPYA